MDGDPAIVYKFTPKYVLKSGSYVTVSSGVIIVIVLVNHAVILFQCRKMQHCFLLS